MRLGRTTSAPARPACDALAHVVRQSLSTPARARRCCSLDTNHAVPSEPTSGRDRCRTASARAPAPLAFGSVVATRQLLHNLALSRGCAACGLTTRPAKRHAAPPHHPIHVAPLRAALLTAFVRHRHHHRGSPSTSQRRAASWPWAPCCRLVCRQPRA